MVIAMVMVMEWNGNGMEWKHVRFLARAEVKPSENE